MMYFEEYQVSHEVAAYLANGDATFLDYFFDEETAETKWAELHAFEAAAAAQHWEITQQACWGKCDALPGGDGDLVTVLAWRPTTSSELLSRLHAMPSVRALARGFTRERAAAVAADPEAVHLWLNAQAAIAAGH